MRFLESEKRRDVLFELLERVFGYGGTIHLKSVDFSRPWYRIYLPYWNLLAFTLIVEIIVWGFFSILPLWIANILRTQSINHVYILGLVFVGLLFLAQLSLYRYMKTLSGLMQSFTYEACKFFLVVDPIHHSTRESGKIIAKIQRSTHAIESITDTILFNGVSFIMQILVVTITFIRYDMLIGLLAGFSLVLLVFLSIFLQMVVVKVVVPKDIEQGDIQQQVEVESLQQVALIRASFATPEQIEKLKRVNIRTAEVLATVWSGFVYSSTVPRLIFIMSMIGIFIMTMNLIQIGRVELLDGVALMTMYIGSYGTIINAGRYVERIISNIDKLKDTFRYIQSFGHQTYPV